VAQRLLRHAIARGALALAAARAVGAPPGVKYKYYHGREGDHSGRFVVFFRSVGNAYRIGGNDRGQPALLRALAAQKRPSVIAALCPAAPTGYKTFPTRSASD
jgi:hypothetical protein